MSMEWHERPFEGWARFGKDPNTRYREVDTPVGRVRLLLIRDTQTKKWGYSVSPQDFTDLDSRKQWVDGVLKKPGNQSEECPWGWRAGQGGELRFSHWIDLMGYASKKAVHISCPPKINSMREAMRVCCFWAYTFVLPEMKP